VSRGLVTEHDIDPRDLGIQRAQLSDLVGGSPQHNADIVHSVLAGEPGPIRDIVLLNAAAGLVAFDLANDASQVQVAIVDRFRNKLAVAAEAIDSGVATAKLSAWIAATAV
jgi:anthranilate phosphoribosyltransferase